MRVGVRGISNLRFFPLPPRLLQVSRVLWTRVKLHNLAVAYTAFAYLSRSNYTRDNTLSACELTSTLPVNLSLFKNQLSSTHVYHQRTYQRVCIPILSSFLLNLSFIALLMDTHRYRPRKLRAFISRRNPLSTRSLQSRGIVSDCLQQVSSRLPPPPPRKDFNLRPRVDIDPRAARP